MTFGIAADPLDLRGARKHIFLKPYRGSGSKTNIDFEKFSEEDKEKYLDNARKLLNR